MISVVIPTYNNMTTISAAIDSVQCQDFDDLEIIVVDDGSSDATEDTLKGYIDKGIIRYFKKDNGGCSSARNYGIEKAKGDLIAFLDADDEWLQTHLQKSVDLLTRGKFDWVAGGYFKCQKDGSRTYRTISGSELISYDHDTSAFRLLDNGVFWFSSVPILITTLVFRKAVLEAVGGFDISCRYSEDWDLFLRVEETGYQGGFLDEPQAIYHYSPAGITKSKTFLVLRDHLVLARKHSDFLGFHLLHIRESYADFCWHAGRTFWDMRYYLAGLQCLLESLRFDFRSARIVGAAWSRLTARLATAK